MSAADKAPCPYELERAAFHMREAQKSAAQAMSALKEGKWDDSAARFATIPAQLKVWTDKGGFLTHLQDDANG